MFDAKTFLASLTSRPGVYRMLDDKAKTLYVGKAKNLKNRVSSYFRAHEDARIQALVHQIDNIEITITHNEKEALLLENEYIKTLAPRYNIVLKDDKSYPYLFLSSHPFPRLVFHRGPQTKKGRYFGPYPSAYAVKETLSLLQRLFKLRQCDDTFFKNRSRPCLQYQIQRCTAPCCDYIQPHEYQEDVKHAWMFLDGQHQNILKELISQMEHASQELAYEEAARYRDQIQSIQKIIEQQAVYGKEGDLDVVSLASSGEQVVVYVLFIRDGKMSGSKTFFPKITKVIESADIVRSFLCQYYLNSVTKHSVPKEIIISETLEDETLVLDTLQEQNPEIKKISHQVRGQKKRWQQLAVDNAHMTLKQRLGSKNVYYRRLQALQEVLGLATLTRVECFDISHTMGEATVGSCVVFDEEGPKKSDYRQYNIDEGKGDDYAAMEQVLMRRYTKLKEGNGFIPELILIDGGRGQLGIAQRVVKECQMVDVMLVGVAKGEGRKPGLETLYVLGGNDGASFGIVHLPPHHEALHLIQQIRDEAHRFAIQRHRAKRGKSRTMSFLEAIPGIGPKRRQALLTHFGGQKGLSAASEEGIAGVPGISRALAKVIYQHLHDS